MREPAKRANKKIPSHTVKRGSRNVFADIGLPDADELQAKADLAIATTQIIRTQGMTQEEAAGILGLDQPKVS